MNTEVRVVTEDQWPVLRGIRLRALADAPTSFGSTLAREQEFAEEVWRERARGSATSRLFLAWTNGDVVGIAGVVDEDDGSAQLVSVWVSPESRGQGVARAMTATALGFAAGHGFGVVRLWVTDGNDAARALYESFGFVPTGSRQPLPSNPALQEQEMELRNQAALAGPSAGHP